MYQVLAVLLIFIFFAIRRAKEIKNETRETWEKQTVVVKGRSFNKLNLFNRVAFTIFLLTVCVVGISEVYSNIVAPANERAEVEIKSMLAEAPIQVPTNDLGLNKERRNFMSSIPIDPLSILGSARTSATIAMLISLFLSIYGRKKVGGGGQNPYPFGKTFVNIFLVLAIVLSVFVFVTLPMVTVPLGNANRYSYLLSTCFWLLIGGIALSIKKLMAKTR